MRKAIKSVEFVIVTKKVITLTREQVLEYMTDRPDMPDTISDEQLDKVMRIIKREAIQEIEDDAGDEDFELGDHYDIESIIEEAHDKVVGKAVVKDAQTKTA